MRFYKFSADGVERWGYFENGRVVGITDIDERDETGEDYDLSDVGVLPPFFGTKIICLGLNYKSHAEENRARPSKKPILFSKATTAVVGDGDAVIKPKTVQNLDYEVELACVVGKNAKRVGREEAYDHILGYTILNDISARDLQFSEKQWFRSKSGDTFCPLGPCIVSKEEIEDPMDLDLEMKINGKTMQKSNTGEMIFDIPAIFEFITEVMTLMPGDIVATGTPAGVGAFREPPYYLKDGDIMEAWVEDVGMLQNRVAFSPTLDY